MKLTKLLIFFFYGCILLLWGCGTTNQAVLPKQFFHDLTSRYNAHFNVNEKLKGVIKLSEQNHKDKFDSVIPVYYYSDPKEFASYSGDLEDIVKRSTLAIQIHAPSNWSDDHFILIGVANYLKGDYDKADNTFKYITTQYKEGVDYVKVMRTLGKRVGKYKKAKKKVIKPKIKSVVNKDGTVSLVKEDNRPSKSIWIHTPARSEALMWLIRTYTRQGKFEEANTVLTYTKSDNLFYKNFDYELHLVEADLRVSQKNYAAAIAPLEAYLVSKKVIHNKKRKVRPLFVLAQCYAAVGDYTHAAQNYAEVLKSHPSYDMEFYAKIKMAKLGRADNGADMRTMLVKMTRDPKYKDYWDQVYYELALLSLSKNNRVEARKFLHESVDNSTSNTDQKAMSFLKLAELDYEEEAYVSAKFYYDSTLAAMAPNDSRYPEIDERNKMLDNLVKQLNIIAQEDSLQKLAALPKEEQEKIARKAIQKKEEEEEAKKDAAEADKQQKQLDNFSNPIANQQNPNQVQKDGQSSWPFYNTNTRAMGYNDFVRKWGKRKLEENWRRKNKASGITEDEVVAVDTTAGRKDTVKDEVATGTAEEQMLAGVPNTPAQMEKSVGKITDAYYTAGTIYKDGLDAYNKAEDMFETLNAKYPKHKLLLESYYNLYLIAMLKKDGERAERYKALILSQFPESVIAKILRDPAYLNEAKKQEQVADNYYQGAYNDYVAGRLDSAWYKCQMADVVLKPNPLAPKFELLSALVLGKQNKLTEYMQALNKIINRNGDMAIKKTAQDLLSLLNRSTLPQVDLSRDTTRRDSLNMQYGNLNLGKPDTSDLDVLKKMEEARLKVQPNGPAAATGPDTAVAKPAPANAPAATKDTTGKVAPDNVAKTDTTRHAVPAEDITSPYKEADAAPHYFVVYINDPAVTLSAEMQTKAKIEAYNAAVFADKRLATKRILLNQETKVLRVAEFKTKADALVYFKAVKAQPQLYSDLKPGQYTLVVISNANYPTLTDLKDIEEYLKFFNRVYK